ncbi:MAG: DUF3365 domain-containing protein [Flavobacteriales bacterium]|jgi:hypothetical protein|nr:DUF3365 domain-containing protein [Flavobacteriales bacterium]MCB0756951.1 DUF3365 domain-containing protein [Flavobacteriales bacterium]
MNLHSGSLVVVLLTLSACGGSLSSADEAAALEKGAAITDASFQALSEKLQQAMKQGGPAHAVDFCSLNAQAMVDSLSSAHGASIRRTSDRIRNPHDAPVKGEAAVLRQMLTEWEKENRMTDVPARVELEGDSLAYYRPIFINSPACLKCHGMPGSTLDSSALAVISERYKEDRATGYALNELRGMWSVRWQR